MPRYFTLLEAESLLPEVQTSLHSCIEAKQDYERADDELTAFLHHVTIQGGIVVDREKVRRIRDRKNSAAQVIKSALETIAQIGCHIKDLDTGLIDFPTLYQGQEVYLCWKLGERGIQFWHHIADGFGGRRPVDSEFLAQHRGDPSH